MQEAKERAWQQVQKRGVLTSSDDLIILASIIEKETSQPDERPHVAAVFLNRLEKGLPLQADPTVMYGLEKLKKEKILKLTKMDLRMETPYNTYLIKGLPPTPICCPGKAAIMAVIKPLQTEDLYFVANGKGGHTFSKSYDEHKVHHERWRKLREEIHHKKKRD